MGNKKFPLVSKELLEELEQRFPDRMPDNASSLENYLIKQGTVLVVRLLRYQYDLQNQNILEK